jgi:retron-type reverse transcriptase
MSLPVITHDRVHGILKSMNVRKASGPDGIPPRVLRECASELAPVLVQLFSLCLNTNTFPLCWKRAFVQPIPKKGSRSDPSNYRPIALTCVLSKIFETLLNSHFLDHLESHSLLSDHQYGFRRSRSTGDILSYLTDLWSSALRDFGESCVVALDISKAFDRVWHASLLSKLPSFSLLTIV